MAQDTAKKPPCISIFFLGSPGVGKATFLSRLPHVQHPNTRREDQKATPTPTSSTKIQDENDWSPPQLPNDSEATLVPGDSSNTTNSSATRLGSPPQHPNDSETTLVPTASGCPPRSHIPSQPMNLGSPLKFTTHLYSRPYSITIHTNTSQLFIDPFPTTDPDLLVLTFSIPNRASLFNIQRYWMPQYHMHYPTSSAPVLLLGLQRDLRTAKKVHVEGKEEWEYESVMPEEGVQTAQAMRVDRYAECSAVTGELMWEAVQDLTKMAAQAAVDRETGREYASECAVL